ncbi:gamma-glutamylcyclotransferase family protein, partial [Kineosporia babensis]
GWQVIALPDQPYPTIIRDAQAAADGELFTDLSVAEWKALDAFEAPDYLLTRVDTTAGPAYIYAAPDDHGLTPAPWDLDDFREQQLPNYLDRCQRWRQHYNAQQQ